MSPGSLGREVVGTLEMSLHTAAETDYQVMSRVKVNPRVMSRAESAAISSTLSKEKWK